MERAKLAFLTLSRIGFLLAFSLLLAACGGGGSDSPAPQAAGATPGSSTGTQAGATSGSSTASGSDSADSDETTMLDLSIAFEDVPSTCRERCGLDYANPISQPARFINFEVFDAESGALVELSSPPQTDQEGRASIELSRGARVKVRVIASSQAERGSVSWDISVRDNQGSSERAQYPLYSVVTDTIVADSPSLEQSIELPSGWLDGAYVNRRDAAPFAVLDRMIRSAEFFAESETNLALPSLNIFWSVDNRPDETSIGTSFYADGDLWILGDADVDTDEFDDHVLAHEWVHYLLDRMSKDTSTGGAHDLTEFLDARLAYSEGIATALSCLMLNDSVYLDTFGNSQSQGFGFDCETGSQLAFVPGWFSEASIIQLIYDIFDDSRDGDADTVNLDRIALADVLFGKMVNQDSGTASTIYSFLSGVIEASPQNEQSILALADQQAIAVGLSAVDVLATGETNAGQSTEDGDASEIASILPLYEPIISGDSAKEVCLTDGFGQPNKLGNRRLMRFVIENSGSYRISVNSADPENGDPDVYVYSGNQLVNLGVSEQIGTEILDVELNSGAYWMDVHDYDLLFGEGAGSTCQTVALDAI